MKINSPGGCKCCGCAIKEFTLWPDLYFPNEVRCYVREKTVISTKVGEADATETDSTIERTDTRMVAGRWEWEYPETSSSEEGVTTTVNKTVYEERRLAVSFDVSSQLSFASVDNDSDPIIVSSTIRINAAEYLRTALSTHGTVSVSASMYGAWLDEDFPESISNFDSLRDSANGNYPIDKANSNLTDRNKPSYADVTSELPSQETSSIMFLIDSDGDDSRGMEFSEFKLSMTDRIAYANSNVDMVYDWKNDFIQTSENTFESVGFLPNDNYQLDLSSLTDSNFFSASDRSLTVRLVEEVDDSESGPTQTNFFTVKFDISIGNPVPDSTPTRWPWTLRSTGSCGTIEYVTQNFATNTYDYFNGKSKPASSKWSSLPIIRVRGSVVEQSGGERIEEDVTATYQMVPFWHGAESPPQCKMIVEIEGVDPHPGKIGLSGIAHDADGENQNCPGITTCDLIDDYAHPEWRVLSLSLSEVTFKRFDTAVHNGCGAVLSPHPEYADYGLWWRNTSWIRNAYVQYTGPEGGVTWPRTLIEPVDPGFSYTSGNGTTITSTVDHVVDPRYAVDNYLSAVSFAYENTGNKTAILHVYKPSYLPAFWDTNPIQSTHDFNVFATDFVVQNEPADLTEMDANVVVTVAKQFDYVEVGTLPALPYPDRCVLVTSRMGGGLVFLQNTPNDPGDAEWVLQEQIKSIKLDVEYTEEEMDELVAILPESFTYHFSVSEQAYALTKGADPLMSTTVEFIPPPMRFVVNAELNMTHLTVFDFHGEITSEPVCITVYVQTTGTSDVESIGLELLTQEVPDTSGIPEEVYWDGGLSLYVPVDNYYNINRLEGVKAIKAEVYTYLLYGDRLVGVRLTGEDKDVEFYTEYDEVSVVIGPYGYQGSNIIGANPVYSNVWDRMLDRTTFAKNWESIYIADPTAPTNDVLTRLSSAEVAVRSVTRTIHLEKIVEEWHDRNLPEIEYSIEDAIEDADLSDMIQYQSAEASATNSEPTTEVEICITSRSVELKSLELIIGPSTYEP